MERKRGRERESRIRREEEGLLTEVGKARREKRYDKRKMMKNKWVNPGMRERSRGSESGPL